MLIQLFVTFLKIGFISFGGGYAMIPIIDHEVISQHHWITPNQFMDLVAIAGMSPGAIATNTALLIGYSIDGVLGAIVATIGVVLPSLIIVVFVGIFFASIQKKTMVQSAFYGMRQVITGLVFFAAVTFATKNGISEQASISFINIGIIFITFFILLKTSIHPALVIVLAGVFGMFFFS